jgi:DNA repair protein RecO (recombination protein O)
MLRNYRYDALVLRSRLSGESNREVTFLTAEEGLVRATVFGGPKSRLRAHTAPFHRGKLWIYRNPANDFFKVTDFDVEAWRPGIRELYERAMAASAIAETVLESQGGGGDWADALSLADGVLDALDGADEAACRGALIYFLWNWAEFLGQRPDIGRCASCACEAPDNGLLWYSLRDGTAVCPSCVALPAGYDAPGYLPLRPGVRRLLAEGRFTPEREAKALVTAVMAGVLGKRLAAWDF